MLIKQEKINKPWGYEVTWTKTSSTVGKILGIDRGQSLARSKNTNIEENLLVTSGTLTISTCSTSVDLKRGQSYYILPIEEYKLSAQFGDVELILIKTTI